MRIKFPTWQDPRHEEATRANDHFRKVLFMAQHSQLVLMSLKPGEEIGRETHDLDQFIRIEAGRGAARLNGKDYPVQDGSALVIPAGTEHNIINQSGDEPLKLYTRHRRATRSSTAVSQRSCHRSSWQREESCIKEKRIV